MKRHWNTVHGLHGTPIHKVWSGMVNRCHCPTSKHYPGWGGRGITVCERWRNDVAAFAADMGPRPDGCTLERRDNSKGYSPDNCYWATPAQQAANRRTPSNSKTGITGVCWNKRGKTYETYICRSGQNVRLGRRQDFFEACCLRKSAEAQERGAQG